MFVFRITVICWLKSTGWLSSPVGARPSIPPELDEIRRNESFSVDFRDPDSFQALPPNFDRPQKEKFYYQAEDESQQPKKRRLNSYPGLMNYGTEDTSPYLSSSSRQKNQAYALYTLRGQDSSEQLNHHANVFSARPYGESTETPTATQAYGSYGPRDYVPAPQSASPEILWHERAPGFFHSHHHLQTEPGPSQAPQTVAEFIEDEAQIKSQKISEKVFTNQESYRPSSDSQLGIGISESGPHSTRIAPGRGSDNPTPTHLIQASSGLLQNVQRSSAMKSNILNQLQQKTYQKLTAPFLEKFTRAVNQCKQHPIDITRFGYPEVSFIRIPTKKETLMIRWTRARKLAHCNGFIKLLAPEERLVLQMSMLTRSIWFQNAIYLERIKPNNEREWQRYQESLFSWISEMFYTPKDSLPVVGFTPEPPRYYNKQDFGKIQRLVIDYLTIPNLGEDVETTAQALIGIWYKEIEGEKGIEFNQTDFFGNIQDAARSYRVELYWFTKFEKLYEP